LSSTMKVALVLSILVLLIGLGYSFKLSDFFEEDTQRQSEEDTQRQSEVEDQILPVFAIAFFASLFNSLFFGIQNQNTGNTCQCGVRGPNRRRSGDRIVGGEDAEAGEFPWQVRIELINDITDGFCGGTLLSSDTVLTLASCFTSRPWTTIGPNDFRAIVGDTDRLSPDGEQTFVVRSILPHPDFDFNTQENDFAIIKLATPVTFSDRIAPICLPTATTNYDNVRATLTGWGTDDPALDNFNILQEADVRTMTNADCSAGFSGATIPADLICASDIANTFCSNDQGSPLITNEGRFNSLIGMVSGGGAILGGLIGCDPAAPGLYARVTSGLPWIEQQISGNTCPRPT